MVIDCQSVLKVGVFNLLKVPLLQQPLIYLSLTATSFCSPIPAHQPRPATTTGPCAQKGHMESFGLLSLDKILPFADVDRDPSRSIFGVL